MIMVVVCTAITTPFNWGSYYKITEEFKDEEN